MGQGTTRRGGMIRRGLIPGTFAALSLLAAWGGIALSPALHAGSADEWRTVPIPETWKEPPRVRASEGAVTGRDGFAWYRCEVTVPDSWRGRGLELFVEPVDDARATYINGVQVSASGTFPPRYRSGLGEPGRDRIPEGVVRPGEPNVIAVRVYYSDGRSNFAVAPPALFDTEGREAIRLEGPWEYHAGDEVAWADGPILSDDARYDRVDPVDDLDAYLQRRRGDSDPLTPTVARDRFVVADDLAVDLVLAEPDIAQPLHVSFDERGRLWLIEYRQYPEPAGLTMLSRDKFLRTVYDKVPEPPPHGTPGRDRISIHEDSNGDGVFDRHTVFVDGLNLATAVAVGRGGAWVLNPPYLLFYPDRDGDDHPDGDPEVHLEGFGLEDTHSLCNSLRWGPDGWLYAAQGSTVTGKVRRPGDPDKSVVNTMGQLIWRYHPETRRYEVFAEGGGNTFGVEIDSKGRTFSGHNGGDTRGFHYVQGGYSQKGFTKHGALSNPYAFGYFPPMSHASVPRFTHTFVIDEGGALPEAYHGLLFGIEPLQGQIVASEIAPDGSTFQTRDIARPVTTDDPWFRPVDIKPGPDGALYVADFYEQRIDHSSHYAGRIDRSNGRVYRIRARDAAPGPYPGEIEPKAPFDLAAMSGPELLGLLDHPNRWFRQEALRVLGDRKDAALVPALLDTLAEGRTGQHALESLWALNLCGGLDDAAALMLLDHPEPFVRAWTVRLACDDGTISPELGRALASLAAMEPYVAVRSQLASSSRRLPAVMSVPILDALMRHDEDAADPHVPLLIWWAIETALSESPEPVLALFDDAALWEQAIARRTILERLMRRLARRGTRADLLACALMLERSPSPAHTELLMRGFEAALEGRSLTGLPDRLLQAIAASGGGSLPLRVRQGEAVALADARAIVASPTAKAEERIELIQTLSEVRDRPSVPLLLDIARVEDDDTVRSSALAALRPFDDPAIGEAVILLHPALPIASRESAEELLASRPEWAKAFVRAVADGHIARNQVSDTTVRKLLLFEDDGLLASLRQIWGDVESTTDEVMRQQIERLEGVIADGSGNPYSGKSLYLESCGKCHVLFDDGGDIGPSLTSHQRDDLRGMLLAVVNPSAEIREGYETHMALLEDGRVATGFLVDQDDTIVILRGGDGHNQLLARGEIEAIQPIAQSVMPTGLLDGLTDQQVRDLFAYLRSTQPLND